MSIEKILQAYHLIQLFEKRKEALANCIKEASVDKNQIGKEMPLEGKIESISIITERTEFLLIPVAKLKVKVNFNEIKFDLNLKKEDLLNQIDEYHKGNDNAFISINLPALYEMLKSRGEKKMEKFFKKEKGYSIIINSPIRLQIPALPKELQSSNQIDDWGVEYLVLSQRANLKEKLSAEIKNVIKENSNFDEIAYSLIEKSKIYLFENATPSKLIKHCGIKVDEITNEINKYLLAAKAEKEKWLFVFHPERLRNYLLKKKTIEDAKLAKKFFSRYIKGYQLRPSLKKESKNKKILNSLTYEENEVVSRLSSLYQTLKNGFKENIEEALKTIYR